MRLTNVNSQIVTENAKNESFATKNIHLIVIENDKLRFCFQLLGCYSEKDETNLGLLLGV